MRFFLGVCSMLTVFFFFKWNTEFWQGDMIYDGFSSNPEANELKAFLQDQGFWRGALWLFRGVWGYAWDPAVLDGADPSVYESWKFVYDAHHNLKGN